jgi:hypothetical protein
VGFFTSDQIDAMMETTVRAATLVDFQLDTPQYIWNGFGDLSASSHTYKGVGAILQINGLSQDRGAASQQFTIVLSGVDSNTIAATISESDLVQGKIAVVSMLLRDDAWQAIGNPIPIRFGICGIPRVTHNPAVGQDGADRSVSLDVENLFYGRSRPPAGRYTDRDQQTRFSGDRFFERVSLLQNRSVVWPNY